MGQPVRMPSRMASVAALLVASSLVACAPAAGTASGGTAASGGAASAVPAASQDGAPPTADGAQRALDALDRLRVKGRAPQTGYRRTQFGDGWADEDHDGCSTREEILRRDLVGTSRRRVGRCAVVAAGTLADPYSGKRLAFTRGEGTSATVQIDHVVALDDAWQTGAQQLTPARREAFANDPLNLLAVDGRVNQSKGASDAASWLPPNKAFRCAYVARQVAVKVRYGLWVTAAERAAVARVLGTCPAQPVPVR